MGSIAALGFHHRDPLGPSSYVARIAKALRLADCVARSDGNAGLNSGPATPPESIQWNGDDLT